MKVLEKISSAKLLFFPWTVLNTILSGLLGRSILTISLAVPISKLFSIGIQIPQYRFALAGSLLTVACYAINKVSVPQIVKTHLSETQYASYLVQREGEKSLDFFDEFRLLDNYQACATPIECKIDIQSLRKLLPTAKWERVLGTKAAIQTYAKYKFRLTNKSATALRGIMTCMLLSALVLLLIPIGRAVFIIFR
jgi:hypothetical protein